MMAGFRLLSGLKGLRGTRLDLFGYSGERRMERQLIADYEKLLAKIEASLTLQQHATAVALASIPEQIRGYGPIKKAAVERAKLRESELLSAFRQAPGATRQAA
jgi:indolepyruvate ferredoxin oxidoreductase